MITINHTKLSRNTKEILDTVIDNNEMVVVHRGNNREDVVIISLSEWNSWQETNYLNSTKANKNNLLEAIKEIKQGKTTTIDPKELWK